MTEPWRLYIDEDVQQGLANRLRVVGLDAVSTDELGKKGAQDVLQFAFAVRDRRTLVTCNIRHFAMLHEAAVIWPREWPGAILPAHRGVLLVPNGRELSVDDLLVAVRELAQAKDELVGLLLRWRRATGWIDQDNGLPFVATAAATEGNPQS